MMTSKRDEDDGWTVTSLLMEVMHSVERKEYERARHMLKRVLELEPENELAKRYREILKKAIEVQTSSDEEEDSSSESSDESDDDSDTPTNTTTTNRTDNTQQSDDDDDDDNNEENGKESDETKSKPSSKMWDSFDDYCSNNAAIKTHPKKHFNINNNDLTLIVSRVLRFSTPSQNVRCAAISRHFNSNSHWKHIFESHFPKEFKQIDLKNQTFCWSNLYRQFVTNQYDVSSADNDRVFVCACKKLLRDPVRISSSCCSSLPLLEIQYWKTKIEMISNMIKRTSTKETLRHLHGAKKECEWNLKYLSILNEPFQTIKASNFERISLCFTPMMRTFNSISKMSRYYSSARKNLSQTIDRVTEALIFRVSRYCDARYVVTQAKTSTESLTKLECAVETLSRWHECCQRLPVHLSRTMLESALRRCAEMKNLVQSMQQLRLVVTETKRYDAIKVMLNVGLCDVRSGENLNIFDEDRNDVHWEQLHETAMRRMREAIPSKPSVLRGRLYGMVHASRSDFNGGDDDIKVN